MEKAAEERRHRSVPGTSDGPRSRSRVLLAVLLAVLVLPVLGALLVRAVYAGEALPGTSVAGLDVGGLGREDVRTALETGLADRTRDPVVLLGPDGVEFPLEPAGVAYEPDLSATVDAALEAGRTGLVGGTVNAVGALFGQERTADLGDSVDRDLLSAYLDTVAAVVDRAPDPGGVAVVPPGEEADAVSVVEVPPAPGREVDVARAEQVVVEGLRRAGVSRVALPVDEIAPPTTREDVAQTAEQVRAALAGPVVLRGPEGAEASFSPEQLAPVLSTAVQEDGSGLEVRVDEAILLEIVTVVVADAETSPRSPTLEASAPASLDDQGSTSFSPVPATVTVTAPGTPGRDVDEQAATTALRDALLAGQREAQLPVAITPPPVTAEQAASVNALLGTFTTYHACCEGRVRNIQRMAQIIDGAVVAPGASFSINDFVGPRTRAKGFVPAGTIINRMLVDTVGGGVSQFATTMFNAVFFAGLPIEEYQAHSRYISRYPVGREATVNFPGVDLRWTNDTGAPVLVTTSYTSRSITVNVFGRAPGSQTVRAVTGSRSAGGENFTINVTRIVERDGTEASRRTFTTVYREGRDEED